MSTPVAKAGGLRVDVLWRKSKNRLRIERQVVRSSAIPFVQGQHIFRRIEVREAGRAPRFVGVSDISNVRFLHHISLERDRGVMVGLTPLSAGCLSIYLFFTEQGDSTLPSREAATAGKCLCRSSFPLHLI
jgi:hypothetical protein